MEPAVRLFGRAITYPFLCGSSYPISPALPENRKGMTLVYENEETKLPHRRYPQYKHAFDSQVASSDQRRAIFRKLPALTFQQQDNRRQNGGNINPNY
jgi:hypothetical protein